MRGRVEGWRRQLGKVERTHDEGGLKWLAHKGNRRSGRCAKGEGEIKVRGLSEGEDECDGERW